MGGSRLFPPVVVKTFGCHEGAVGLVAGAGVENPRLLLDENGVRVPMDVFWFAGQTTQTERTP